jgi:hypothetical protein|tara:strand:+ start:246 stop:389 length:144 start_codon:yes stop_codon:yes gene_type:complete
LERKLIVGWAKVEGSNENLLALDPFEVRRLEDISVAYPVGEDDFISI